MLAIKTEIGKALRTSSGPDLAAVENAFAAQIARYLGAAIRGRVEGTGNLAGQRFPGWDDPGLDAGGKKKRKTKWTSTRYPDHAVGRPGRDAESFESAAAYHRANATRPGTYHTTGGMWSGLSAVVASTVRAQILFRGRSEGQDARFVRGRSRPLKVSNALKAATVLAQHGVNVLLPADTELALIAEACTHSLAAAVGRALDVQWTGPQPMKGTLDEIFGRVFRARAIPTSAGA